MNGQRGKERTEKKTERHSEWVNKWPVRVNLKRSFRLSKKEGYQGAGEEKKGAKGK